MRLYCNLCRERFFPIFLVLSSKDLVWRFTIIAYWKDHNDLISGHCFFFGRKVLAFSDEKMKGTESIIFQSTVLWIVSRKKSNSPSDAIVSERGRLKNTPTALPQESQGRREKNQILPRVRWWSEGNKLLYLRLWELRYIILPSYLIEVLKKPLSGKCNKVEFLPKPCQEEPHYLEKEWLIIPLPSIILPLCSLHPWKASYWVLCFFWNYKEEKLSSYIEFKVYVILSTTLKMYNWQDWEVLR